MGSWEIQHEEEESCLYVWLEYGLDAWQLRTPIGFGYARRMYNGSGESIYYAWTTQVPSRRPHPTLREAKTEVLELLRAAAAGAVDQLDRLIINHTTGSPS